MLMTISILHNIIHERPNNKTAGSNPRRGAKIQITVDWLAIFSFILNLALAGLGIYQFVSSKKEEENTKSKVKLWQKFADGLKNGLIGIAVNPNNFTNKTVIAAAVSSLSQVATSFDESFVEERFYSEKEVKEKREKALEEQNRIFQSFHNPSK